MIKQLQHTNINTAKTMKAVFQVSYKVEAELLGATDFPPLKRPLEGYTPVTDRSTSRLQAKRSQGV